MTDERTTEQLERHLKGGTEEVLDGSTLADIRGRGRTQRRLRWAAYAGVAAAGLAAAGVLVSAVTHDDRAARDRAPIAERATELSPLAARALREVPGASRLSDWQVLLPTPVGGRSELGEDEVPDDYVAAGPVDIGARLYTGVTAYQREAFPAWLWDGVQDYEQHVLGSEEEGYPVGSTDTGIIVDGGPLDLACIRPLPQWSDTDGDQPDGRCFPAMLGQDGDARTYQWGMGTDDFLQKGKDLELFSADTYTDGSARTVWIGGTDGTDVATVTLVATDGTRVEATVAAGTFVPGETMFWGTVSGDLAVAVTRDADGDVLERHRVEPCSDPTDCEVR